MAYSMNEKQQEAFWKNLQKAFQESGLSNKDFAGKIGITPPYLTALLKRKRLGKNIIFQVCEKLGKPISEMLGEFKPEVHVILKYAEKMDSEQRQDLICYIQDEEHRKEEERLFQEFKKLRSEKKI